MPLRFFRASLLAACVYSCSLTPTQEQLLAENDTLKARLAEREEAQRNLKAERDILAGDNAELKRVLAILETEKSTRVSESTNLRVEVRGFIHNQIDALKEFLVKSDLLDFVGEALIPRAQLDDAPVSFIDRANPLPSNGSLVGIQGVFVKPTDLIVSILRPVGDRYVVVWRSGRLAITQSGSVRTRFSVSVGVEAGDLIAYSFPQTPAVKFDLGTGDARITRKRLELGNMIDPGDVSAQSERRAYSLGVLTILDGGEGA